MKRQRLTLVFEIVVTKMFQSCMEIPLGPERIAEYSVSAMRDVLPLSPQICICNGRSFICKEESVSENWTGPSVLNIALTN